MQIPVVVEQLHVGKRVVETGAVRVRIEPAEIEARIVTAGRQQTAHVERVARGEVVEDRRAPWHEGDVLVVPVYEERVVLQRQLVLKEELRVTLQARQRLQHTPMTLLRERAVVERRVGDGPWVEAECAMSIEKPINEGTIMKQTLVAVFDQYAAAERAAEALKGRGFSIGDVRLTADNQATAGATSGASSTAYSQADNQGVMAQMRGFFSELFNDDDDGEVKQYAEAVRRGGGVIRVDVEDGERADTARSVLEAAGAVDIDEQMQRWGADTDTPATGSNATAAVAYGTTANRDTGDLGNTATARDQGDVIPVIKEELQVGKRTVSTGGVRVYARTVETPVSESVELRSEHANVERRPVDRPATAADLAALGDRNIEVRETAEEAVVAKSARVVEEVRVGKTVEQHTEQVTDTVRNTEVQVERMAAGNTDNGDDTYFRNHFQTSYGTSGGRYEDYAPAYSYGSTLRGDQRYADRKWDDVEGTVRSDWESKNPGGTWERMKAAVRHGWDRVTN